MLKHKAFTIPFYRGKLVVVLCDNVKELQKKVPTFDAEYIYANAIKADYKDSRGYYVILNPFYPDERIRKGDIAHECFHCTSFLSMDTGIQMDVDNDEAHAYIIGWMVDMVWKCLDEWKVSSKIK